MNEYTFDCWHLDNGIPSKKYILSLNEQKAIEAFKELYPNWGYDYPYL